MSEFYFNTKHDAEAVAWRLRESGLKALNVQNVVETQAGEVVVEWACKAIGVVQQGQEVAE